MKSESLNVEGYVQSLPEDRRTAINKLREIFKKNLPEGFSEEINYGMIGYVVPLSVYPQGYSIFRISLLIWRTFNVNK